MVGRFALVLSLAVFLGCASKPQVKVRYSEMQPEPAAVPAPAPPPWTWQDAARATWQVYEDAFRTF